MILTRSIDNATVEVNKPRRQIRAIIGSEIIDRHGTIVDPVGLEVENFKRTAAIVPWAHSKDATRGEMPIGNCVDIGLTTFKGRSVMLADTEFWDDPFSEKLFNAYAERKLNGWSISFLAKNESPPTREEMRSRPELSRCSTIYRSTELTHYSAVATPSNVDATTIEVLRSLGTVATTRSMDGTSSLSPSMQRALLAESQAAFNRGAEKMVRELIRDIELIRRIESRRRSNMPWWRRA
jgi:hypothetical protein